MKVLVIGGGGREHALAWKLAQGERVQRVYVAPGNGGTALDPALHNVTLSGPEELADFVTAEKIALTVVGPEAPLAAGVVGLFRARALRICDERIDQDGAVIANEMLHQSKPAHRQTFDPHRCIPR